MTFDAIAEALGVSPVRAWQLVRKAEWLLKQAGAPGEGTPVMMIPTDPSQAGADVPEEDTGHA